MGRRATESRAGRAETQGNYLGQISHAVTIVLALVAIVDVFYAVMVTSWWRDVLWGLLVMDFLGIVGALASIAVVRRGHVLFGSIAIFVLAIVQIVITTWVLGWESGVHLFLIAGGSLAVLAFTDRQKSLRWGFGLTTAAVFVFCQFALDGHAEQYGVTEQQTSVLFTANAIFTSVAAAFVALVTHTRASTAWREVAASSARAEYLANTDELTGLPNRRPVLELLDTLAEPGSARYCVAVADLDHFKSINDAYGHACGDTVLAVVAQRLREQMRARDIVGRWGGEEFVFVLPSTGIDEAAQVMERVRALVADHAVPCSGHSHEVRISIGLSDGLEDERSHRVLKRADDALYQAKEQGRDRLVVRAVSDVARGLESESARQADTVRDTDA